MSAETPSRDELLAMANAMDMASVVANKAGVVTTPEMTPEKAADMVRNIIASAIQEHANAIRRSVYQRGRESDGGDDAAA